MQVARLGYGHRLAGLAASGVGAERPSLRHAFRWLLDRQAKSPGDWAETVRAEPGGWYFEYANEFYPDSDDTAMALMALQTQFDATSEPRPPCRLSWAVVGRGRGGTSVAPQRRSGCGGETAAAIDRGLRWMLAMQNDDGGWGAFDRNNDREFLCYIPFADHNAMIDPSTPDLTGRVLEALGRWAGAWAMRRSIGPLPMSAASSRPTAVGSAAGASTISMAPGSR